MNKQKFFFLSFFVAALAAGTTTRADTEFTYQGELKDNGGLANGLFNMDFSLWNASVGGNQIGSTLVHNGVQVIEGKFAVELDFGADAFDNSGRWLKIVVSGFTLSPRNPITRSPYSIQTRGIYVDQDENVGIGTINPQHALHVADDVNTGPVIIGHATRVSGSGAVGVTGQSEGVGGTGVYGYAASPTGLTYGVRGYAYSTNGIGVYGSAQRETGISYGLYGLATSNSGTAVYGHASSPSGSTYAFRGVCASPTGFAGYFAGRGYFSGNTGFGTTNPQNPVHAFSNNGTAIYASSNNDTAIRGEGDWGVEGTSTDPDGRGLFGYGASLTGTNYGVYGLTASENGRGVYGYATNTAGSNYGIYGESASSAGRGVYGRASNLTGVNHGVHGESDSVFGRGVVGHATSPTGTTQGVRGEVESPTGAGVVGLNNATTGDANGVYGQSESSSGTGVVGSCAGTDGTGVLGVASSATGTTFGVYGSCSSEDGFAFFANSAGTDYGSFSSRRWKTNIQAIDDPLGKLAQIRGVYYDWDADHGGNHDVGMIAEEVGAIMPEVVQYEENGIDAIGMDYSRMTPLLVEAVNALRAEKETQIAELRAENKSLRARFDALEPLINQLQQPVAERISPQQETRK